MPGLTRGVSPRGVLPANSSEEGTIAEGGISFHFLRKLCATTQKANARFLGLGLPFRPRYRLCHFDAALAEEKSHQLCAEEIPRGVYPALDAGL